MILRVINTVGSVSKMHRLIIRLFFHNHIVWTAYPSPDRVWGFTGRLRSYAERMFDEKRALWTEKTGSICMRSAPDKVDFHPDTSSVFWALYPWMMGQEVMRRGISIFERTMVTRLLTHDGAVVGATAVDIKTGGFIIFRAKSVIVATGSFGWLYGWCGVSSLSPVHPECTGDGHALLHYAGAELQNMEFGAGEMYQMSPATLAGSFGGVAAMASSPETYDAVCNKDGEYFLKGAAGLDDFATLTMKYGLLYERSILRRKGLLGETALQTGVVTGKGISGMGCVCRARRNHAFPLHLGDVLPGTGKH